MRRTLLCVTLAALTLACGAKSAEQTRAETEALAAVERVVEALERRQPNAGDDPADWGLRAEAHAAWIFGSTYTNLNPGPRSAVDGYARIVLSGMLSRLAKAKAASTEAPRLAYDATNPDQPEVTCTIGREAFLFVLTREGATDVEIVDVGVGGKSSGAMLRFAWEQAQAKAPDGMSQERLLMGFIAKLIESIQAKARRR
ncbi:MAG: hypothetical protein QNJ98_17595 [Planctomycetota bacterium]|nr:hypothetical protein [Planctomycetota bacterium]